MYVNYLFCMNEVKARRKSDYFIYIPEEHKVLFPTTSRKRSTSIQKKDVLNIKLPAITRVDISNNSISFHNSFMIYNARKLPSIKKRKNSLVMLSNHYHKLDQSSQVNF